MSNHIKAGKNCVFIVDDGRVDCEDDNTMLIRVGGKEGRTIMTTEESEIVRRVITRMDFTPVKEEEGE